MKWKHKLCLTLTLAAILLATLPLVTARADCPPDSEVYVGGPVSDSTAVRGSMDNPAGDLDEAFDICDECSGGGIIHYKYNADQKVYERHKACGPPAFDETGVLLAQPVVTALLGLLAVGLLSWGIYARQRLKHLQTG